MEHLQEGNQTDSPNEKHQIKTDNQMKLFPCNPKNEVLF
jgi:hypothetical protein